MKIRRKDFLRAVERADKRYFDMVNRRAARARSEAAARKGRHLMKKIGKFAIGAIVTAAVLAGGGITAMVAMRGSLGGYNTYDGSSIKVTETHDEKIELHLTPEGTYTEQSPSKDYSDYFIGKTWVAETDNGYYFRQSSYDEIREEDGDELYGSTENMRHYYAYKDKATGKTLPLCARPNCLHDGNEYCEASTKAYSTGRLIAYENELYRIGTALDSDGSGTAVVVLRYAPTGTGIEELARFPFSYNNCDYWSDGTIMYRGYLFASVTLHFTVTGDSLDEEHTFEGGAVVCYELATGKASILWSDIPDLEKGGSKDSPGALYGRGDKLYMQMAHKVRELDLNTLEVKTVSNADTAIFTQDALFYEEGNYDDSKFMRYDYETGEETRIRRTEVSFDATHGEFAADDKYFYLSYFSQQDADNPGSNWQQTLIVTDHGYHPIVTLDLGKNDTHSGREFWSDNEYLYRVMQQNPVAYTTENGETQVHWNFDIDRNVYLMRIKIDDLLAGKGTDAADWETLLTLSEVTLKRGTVETSSHMQITYH